MMNLADLKHKQVVLLSNSELRHLSISQGNIVIKNQDDEVLTKLSRHQVLAIMSIGHITFTSVMADYCQKNGIALILMNERLRPILFISQSAEANFLLRQTQYLMADNMALLFAKQIIANKIGNQLLLLKNIRNKSDELKQAIIHLKTYQEQSLKAGRLDYLMGVEGNSAKTYFKYYFAQLKHSEWQGRKPRLKLDPVNVVLDMGYTLLFNYIECNLRLFGFDVYRGVLHQLWFKRKSLVCDFVEPFRPIIDKAVLTAFNLGKFKSEHFSMIKMQYILKKEYSREYHSLLMSAIIDYKSEIFVYIRDFYRIFMQSGKSVEIFDFPYYEFGEKLESECDE